MILELINLLWVETPKGRGRALFLIDYGPESDLYWVIAGDNGECWTVENPEITIVDNWTLGRRNQQRLKKRAGVR